MCISVVMIITILVPPAEIKAMISIIQLGHNSAHTGLIGKIHLTFNKLRKTLKSSLSLVLDEKTEFGTSRGKQPRQTIHTSPVHKFNVNNQGRTRHTSIIPVLKRWRQEYQELKTSPSYIIFHLKKISKNECRMSKYSPSIKCNWPVLVSLEAHQWLSRHGIRADHRTWKAAVAKSLEFYGVAPMLWQVLGLRV